MEHQARVALAVAEAVEFLQRGNAQVKHAVAALLVHIGSRVAGHGSHDLDTLFRQKFCQPFLPGLKRAV